VRAIDVAEGGDSCHRMVADGWAHCLSLATKEGRVKLLFKASESRITTHPSPGAQTLNAVVACTEALQQSEYNESEDPPEAQLVIRSVLVMILNRNCKSVSRLRSC
jgi:hypothetical protein